MLPSVTVVIVPPVALAGVKSAGGVNWYLTTTIPEPPLPEVPR
jgi:hypothetical protein